MSANPKRAVEVIRTMISELDHRLKGPVLVTREETSIIAQRVVLKELLRRLGEKP